MTDDSVDLHALWAEAKGDSQEAVEDLFRRYHWLARKISRSKNVPPNIERDDLNSWADAGLFDAIRKFAPESGDGNLHEHFIGYASIRINGSILDGMKSPAMSWAPRSKWRRIQQMRQAQSDLQQELGREPSSAEVAEALGVEVGELPALQQQVHFDPATPDEGFGAIPSVTDNTDGAAEVLLVARRLADGLAAAPESAQRVLTVLFYESADVRTAQERLGVSPAQLRKLRADSVLRLREALHSL